MSRKRSGQSTFNSSTERISTVWANEVELNTRDLRETARRVGLGGSEGHVKLSLGTIDRRRGQIRVLNVAVLLVVCAAMIIVSGVWPLDLPPWLTKPRLLVFVIALAGVFGSWLFQKEHQLRRLAQFLVEEQFHHDVVNRRLKVVETLLESSKAVNQAAGEKRAVETIVEQAERFFDPGRVCFYSHAIDNGIAPVCGSRNLALRDLARVVVEQERSKTLRPPGDASTQSFGVPVLTRNRVYGALCMKTSSPGIDAFEILMTLSLFGEQVAAAIDNARTRERERIDDSRRQYDRSHDSRTGLLPREQFLFRVDKRIKEYGGNAPRVAVLFVDIDDLKRINNSLGYDVGDAVIRHVGERLGDNLPSAAVAGHFGGDEFMVALFDVSGYLETTDLADRLGEVFGEALSVGSRQVYFSASMGIAMPETFDMNATELVRRAHIAMQDAKVRGRGYAVFDTMMLDDADRTMDLQDDLRRALERDEIDIHLQPVFELDTMKLVAAEALGRWFHPEQGAIAAASFIPFTTHGHQAKQLDMRVLEKACTAAQELRARGVEGPVHVNVSTAHLASADFAASLIGIVESHGLHGRDFVIETVDDGVCFDDARSSGNLARLREAGFRIALDDFGGGASSLRAMDNTRIDAVKIARSLLAASPGQGTSRRELAETIVSLADRLDLDVVATGVETDDELEWLKESGCRLGQGRFLGKPLPLDKYVEQYATAVAVTNLPDRISDLPT